ncbi:hypothetical protein D3C75_663950 [compost metagenome]
MLELFILGQLLVQFLLEYAKKVVSCTALDTSVDKIKSLAVNRQDSNDLSIDHPVEIAGPRLHRVLGREGELLTRRCLGRYHRFGCGMDRTGEKSECERRNGVDDER